MKRFIFLIVLSFLTVSVHSEQFEAIDGNIWNQLNNDAKCWLVIGYQMGTARIARVQLNVLPQLTEVLQEQYNLYYLGEIDPWIIVAKLDEFYAKLEYLTCPLWLAFTKAYYNIIYMEGA